ncbi:MAG: energy transducer TonB [Bacteroidales bacterium]|nr:energy transducer TonB [Bacteroidales bacterium]
MKNRSDKGHKEKKFLEIPSYPGGKQAFIKFIEEQLIYPEEALQNLIEGTVYLEYTVDNIGTVGDVIITHGVGFGCDEEALRLVSLLRYDPKRNRGIRMKTKMKTRIRFDLPAHLKPQPTINITYTSPVTENKIPPVVNPGEGYGYTINLE